ncbi:MAG: 6-carboxytetrahydropterin synthase, partial [bacterium]
GKWLDENLDHRMLLQKGDPAIASLAGLGEEIIVTENAPTAENLAKLIYVKMKETGLRPEEVRLWETPSSCAAYGESL